MTAQKSMSTRAWAELLLLALLWGGSFLSIRIALNEIGPLTSVAHRTLWAAAILWFIILARGLPVPNAPRTWFAFGVMGLLNNAIPFTLMAWGQLHISSGLTSIFNAATAIFGVLAAALFFADEKLTRRKLCGVLIGFCGIAVAVGPRALLEFDIRSLAQLAVIAGTVSYALASVWARKTLGAQPPMVAAAGMLTGGAIIMIPAGLVVEGPMRFDLQPATLGAIAYYALCATAFAYLLYYRVLAMAGSGNLMLVTLVIPPIAIVLGALFLDETLPPQALAGFALVALGLLVIDGRMIDRLLRRG